MSSAYIANFDTIDLGMSEVYKFYNNGDNIDPWGTPANMGFHPKNAPSILTLKDLWARKEYISLISLPGKFIESSLSRMPRGIISFTDVQKDSNGGHLSLEARSYVLRQSG